MTSQGMGSSKGKDLWKDSACSSFLEQGREREREVRGGGGKGGEGRAGRAGRGKRREGIRQD